MSKQYQVFRSLQLDPRFKNTEDKDREELFQDYLDELFQREREEKLAYSEKVVEQLKALFEEKGVELGSRWNEVADRMSEEPQFQNAEDLDRLTYYSIPNRIVPLKSTLRRLKGKTSSSAS